MGNKKSADYERVELGWGLRFCISNMLPDDNDNSASPETSLLDSKDSDNSLFFTPIDLHRIHTSSQGLTQKATQQMLIEFNFCGCVDVIFSPQLL